MEPIVQATGLRMTDQLDSNLTAIGLAITLAAGFIVFNAFSISVARRRRRPATLRAVGMTRSQVLRLALTEALLTGGIGVVLGLAAGVVGGTRRQLRGVVTGEAALMAALGAAIGIVAGLGIAVIIPTVYGGNGWGIRDLDHWAAAMEGVRAALAIGLFGWLVAVGIGVLAGLLTAQGMLRRRRLVDELQVERY
jgi:ABC-type antimicrobial peptide transport system permease subunit